MSCLPRCKNTKTLKNYRIFSQYFHQVLRISFLQIYIDRCHLYFYILLLEWCSHSLGVAPKENTHPQKPFPSGLFFRMRVPSYCILSWKNMYYLILSYFHFNRIMSMHFHSPNLLWKTQEHSTSDISMKRNFFWARKSPHLVNLSI